MTKPNTDLAWLNDRFIERGHRPESIRIGDLKLWRVPCPLDDPDDAGQCSYLVWRAGDGGKVLVSFIGSHQLAEVTYAVLGIYPDDVRVLTEAARSHPQRYRRVG